MLDPSTKRLYYFCLVWWKNYGIIFELSLITLPDTGTITGILPI